MLLFDGILHIDFGGGSSYRRMDYITGKFISEFRWDVFVGRGEALFFLFHSMFFKKDPSYFNRFLSELKTKGMRNNKAWIFFLIGTLWKISFARFAVTSIKFLFLLF